MQDNLAQSRIGNLDPSMPQPIAPAIVSRLHHIIGCNLMLQQRIAELKAMMNGDPWQTEERAALPPQAIESLLSHLEGITGDNNDRVSELISRF